jgi:hypothetical protein
LHFGWKSGSTICPRERLALKYYLEEAQGWMRRLDDIAVRLDTLSPTLIAAANSVVTSTSAISITQIPIGSLLAQMSLPAQAPLATFHPPVSQPINLFDRAQAAQNVIQELPVLERDLQQIETPATFNGLQGIATENSH